MSSEENHDGVSGSSQGGLKDVPKPKKSAIRAFNDKVRDSVFGIQMKESFVSIKYASKFSDWSWWMFMTPWQKCTVFHRFGLHVRAWLYVAFGQVVYFQWLNQALKYKVETGDEAKFYNDLLSVNRGNVSFLLAWLLAAFLGKAYELYYVQAKNKSYEVVGRLKSLAMNIASCVNENDPSLYVKASLFKTKARNAIEAAALYSLACSVASCQNNVKTQNEDVLKMKSEEIFNERGYDGKTLLSMHQVDAIDCLMTALCRTIMEETEPSKPTLQGEKRGVLSIRIDGNRMEGMMRNIQEFQNACTGLMYMMSPGKISFAYAHLIYSATNVALIFHVLFMYLLAAMDHANRKNALPFTCFQSQFFRDGSPHDCPTEQYIRFNATVIVYVYIILGCLEMYPFLTSKFWTYCMNPKEIETMVKSSTGPLKLTGEMSSNTLDAFLLPTADADESKRAYVLRRQVDVAAETFGTVSTL
ncbi:hypothetical protein ACHAWT_003924 [Skeletonema menzelii]